MIKNPLVSIILPTYNVERYLLQCLDSIAAQTYRNIEVIIIIDGATDKSYEIAQKYSLRDDRFFVYFQKNAGSGPARNHGLSQATGDFIVFVDPDDWLKPDFVATLYSVYLKTNADFVSSGTILMVDDGRKLVGEVPLKSLLLDDINLIRHNYLNILSDGGLGAPTHKLYRASIIRDYNIQFPDLRRSQDIVFNYRYYNYVKSVAVIAYCGYFYRVEYSNRLLRLKPDYYKTIVLIYNDILALHKQWGINVDKIQLSNIMLNNVLACVESNYIRHTSQNEILNSIDIQRIVTASFPDSLFKKIFKSLFVRKMCNLLDTLMFFKVFIKKIVKIM